MKVCVTALVARNKLIRIKIIAKRDIKNIKISEIIVQNIINFLDKNGKKQYNVILRIFEK